ncbi:MAG: hypothetical protein EBS75_10100 [Betaproteobacteria bacterium]|nr:hypothetical protein [Betaproteobacteria bacterium]
MKISDRASGFLLVSLGALTCYAASLLPTIAGQQVGPQVFPTVIGVALIACGVLIMLGGEIRVLVVRFRDRPDLG